MNWHTLIDAATLATRLDDQQLRIFDCRFDLQQPAAARERYRVAHLPRAQYADLNADLSSVPTSVSGRHPLPAAQDLAARLREWGVGPHSQVVAYDDQGGMFAARLWWLLRWLGHERVAVLDGGLQRWQALGLPVTDAVDRFAPGDFAARPQIDATADADQVAAAAGQVGSCVLDARAAERFRGEIEPLDPVAGHVPGARNHPCAGNLADDGTFLPRAALRERLLTSLAGTAPQAAIMMCGSGVTACHNLLALEHAGLGGARLYPGSWSEWCRDASRPVAKG